MCDDDPGGLTTLNHPAQLANPAWAAGSDEDPETAGVSRAAELERLAAEGDLVAPTHLSVPFGRVEREGSRSWSHAR